jgi:NAD(P) transhydrogenase subunit beta
MEHILEMIPGLAIHTTGLVAAFLLMFGLKRMSSPVTASSGILMAGIGMLVVVLASFLYVCGVTGTEPGVDVLLNVGLAVVALAIGGGLAWWSGEKAAMTSMPQMVALYNGMGGGAAGAIASVELFGRHAHGVTELVVTLLGGLIGAISLSGSIIAWAKLQGILKKPLNVPGQQIFNALVLVATLGAATWGVIDAHGAAPDPTWLGLFFGGALCLGVLMTLPIGGADMPVVISVYNACTGLAVGLEGFVLGNPALMIAGMVVGAAGSLLTMLMAKAMNRSVFKVLFAHFGPGAKHKKGAIKGTLKPVEASDAGIFMRYAASVIIVPGYGLAVSQAEQKLYEFVKLLVAAGVSVKFAIHPVAGRMPGQMDVLLADAGVPYDMIFQLDQINDQFKTTDVTLVIGANDVVNPAARTDKSSPIYGMPILNADQSKRVYCVKRGQGKGYAGIVNELFYAENTQMVYGDAGAVLSQMIEAVRGLGTAAAA